MKHGWVETKPRKKTYLKRVTLLFETAMFHFMLRLGAQLEQETRRQKTLSPWGEEYRFPYHDIT